MYLRFLLLLRFVIFCYYKTKYHSANSRERASRIRIWAAELRAELLKRRTGHRQNCSVPLFLSHGLQPSTRELWLAQDQSCNDIGAKVVMCTHLSCDDKPTTHTHRLFCICFSLTDKKFFAVKFFLVVK